MTFNKYLNTLKFKFNFLNNKYIYYFFILNNITSNVYTVYKNCKLLKIQFLYLKHIRYISSIKWLSFFLNGPFILLVSDVILNLTDFQFDFLKLMAVSINGYFINNFFLLQFWSLGQFYSENFFEILNFLKFLFLTIFFNTYNLKYVLSFQLFYLTQKTQYGDTYYIIIFLIIIQGLCVILSKNSVNSILYLIGCYVLTSGLFLILGAEFIAIF